LIQRRNLVRLKTIFLGIIGLRRNFRVSLDVAIKLPPGHELPEYREVYPKYDTFLGKLARILPPGSTVIDIGANVGDLLASMITQNKELNFLCIEPDSLFFEYLVSNSKRLIHKFPST
jgi:tRNA G46 methylase TrmB